MSEALKVERREKVGSMNNRRLRRTGMVPAVLYGHEEPNVNLQVDVTDLQTVLRHGAHVVDLQGDVSQRALIKELQWDALGIDILHVDLIRLTRGEKGEIALSVELIGRAPGGDAGIVEQTAHEVTLFGPLDQAPEKLELSVDTLELGKHLAAGDVKLPPGFELVTPAEEMVVHCYLRGGADTGEGAGEAPQPAAESPTKVKPKE